MLGSSWADTVANIAVPRASAVSLVFIFHVTGITLELLRCSRTATGTLWIYPLRSIIHTIGYSLVSIGERPTVQPLQLDTSNKKSKSSTTVHSVGNHPQYPPVNGAGGPFTVPHPCTPFMLGTIRSNQVLSRPRFPVSIPRILSGTMLQMALSFISARNDTCGGGRPVNLHCTCNHQLSLCKPAYGDSRNNYTRQSKHNRST